MTRASNQQPRTRQPKRPVTVRQVPAGTLRRSWTQPAAVSGSVFTGYGDGTLTVADYLQQQRDWWADKAATGKDAT